MKLSQWDVVKVRIGETDRDEHPAVIISPDEIAGDVRAQRINVLYGTTRRPGRTLAAHEMQLNGADGLEHATVFNCLHFYQIHPGKVSHHYGRVGAERRRQIARKIVANYRLAI